MQHIAVFHAWSIIAGATTADTKLFESRFGRWKGGRGRKNIEGARAPSAAPLSLPRLSSRPKRSSRGSCCTSSPSLPPSRLGEILALHHKDFPPPSSVSTFPSHLSTHEKPESWNNTRNVKSGGKLASFVSTLIHY